MGIREQQEKAEILFSQAVDLYQQGRFSEAIEKWEATKIIYKNLKMLEQVAEIESNIGIAFRDQGRPSEALEHYEVAKPIFESLKLEHSIATIEMNIGGALSDQGKNHKAIKHFETAKAICKSLKIEDWVETIERLIAQERLEEANKLFSQGLDLYQQGRFNEAVKKWKTAKLISEKLAMLERVAEIEWNTGVALADLDRATEALEHYATAKAIYENLEATERVAEADRKMGDTLQALGKYSEAVERYGTARMIYAKHDMPEMAATLEVSIGGCLIAMGRATEGLEHYQAARQIFETVKMREGVATVEVSIGGALAFLGRITEALEHYEIAKTIFEKEQAMPEGTAEIEKKIGDVFRVLDRPTEALEHYERSKTIWEELHALEEVAANELNIGRILVGLEKYTEALEHYEMAKIFYMKRKMPHRVASVEVDIGSALANLGRYDEALKKYKRSLRVYESLGLTGERSVAYREMSRVSIALDDFESAILYLKRSFELMEQARIGVRSPELQRSFKEQYLDLAEGLCVLYLMLWEREGDSRHLDEALNSLELAKCSLVTESLEAGGGGVSCPEMEKLVIEEDILLKEAQHSYQEIEELRKLRIEGKITPAEFRGRLTVLQDGFEPICKKIERLRSEVLVTCADVGITPIPRTYSVLQRSLEVLPQGERWSILEFASLANKLFVFLVDQADSIQFEVHDVDLGEVKNLTLRCQGIVEKVRSNKRQEANRELSDLSEQLYTILIPKEIGKVLKSKDIEHLIVVPHKFLHWVPFEVLFDGDSYWGLKYAISTTFSLDLVRLCVEKRAKRATELEESTSFFLIKNPLLDLEGADREVNYVLDLLEARRIQFRVLEHEDATQPAFIEAVTEGHFNILHYAGHALFMGKDPSLSHLYLHTDRECPACSGKTKHHTSELLTATEIIQNVKFEGTPIVFLSGCETGIVEVEPGDEMFGLVRALVYAGATSLVLSHWLVRDVVAPVFVGEFYRQLLGGGSVSVALRNARRNVYNADPANFTDWAVLILQGDPFRKLV